MKFIVVLGDGMADYKIKELGDKTPLQYARTPNLDSLAKKGITGMVRTVPEGMSPGSDVANLSVMGYDPYLYYTGRSPLEAVSLGVDMASTDVAFRCNLVTLSEEPLYADKIMLDYSADEISTEESRKLIQVINDQLGTENLQFYAGISYRHVLIWENGPLNIDLTPPHDISGRKIKEYLPKGEQSQKILDIMMKSYHLLSSHSINQTRIKKGCRPANSLWFWGLGKKPELPSFYDKYGLKGAVVCAVDLIKGLGICAGMEVVNVPGATGGTVTNFRGKAQAAVEQLKAGKDFVYVHIEAPDEAGHRGELETKIRTIEEIDEKVIGEIINSLDDFCLMVLPDHPTPLSTRTHAADEVPFLIYQSNQHRVNQVDGYYEEAAQLSKIRFKNGPQLMKFFVGRNAGLRGKANFS